jgi:hypothetical protein
MPRAPRLDYPGAVHHVIGRGIERREIFLSDHDGHDFLDRRAPSGSVRRCAKTEKIGSQRYAVVPQHYGHKGDQLGAGS